MSQRQRKILALIRKVLDKLMISKIPNTKIVLMTVRRIWIVMPQIMKKTYEMKRNLRTLTTEVK